MMNIVRNCSSENLKISIESHVSEIYRFGRRDSKLARDIPGSYVPMSSK